MPTAAGVEWVSPEGLRTDGRRAREVRALGAKLGVLAGADGSAVYEMGNTRALAAVRGPREPARRSDAHPDRGTVRVAYAVAPFAAGERRRRRARGDRATTELALAVRRTLEEAVMLELLPRSVIDVTVEVLGADGGARCCAINAAALALADAGVPLRDSLACCSAVVLDGTALTDANYQEETGGGPLLHVATLPRLDKVVLVQHVEAKVGLDAFEQAFELARKGAAAVSEHMRGALLENTRALATARVLENL